MHILVFHQYYLMPGEAGGSRFNAFARLWRQAGHRVSVIAGNLSIATGKVPAAYRGKLVVRERDPDGVEVWRCAVDEDYSKSYLGRMKSFAGFTALATLTSLRVARPDVVIATSPPLTLAAAGLAAARWHRVPWVFEVRDLWPESAVTTGVLAANSPITRGLYALERWAYARADRINVLTPAFRDDISKRGLAPDGRIVFVPNGADLDAFSPGAPDAALRQELGWGDRFVVLYAGAHGRANALHQLVDAAEALRDRSDILLATVGGGTELESLRLRTQERGLSNLLWHGPVPKGEMPRYIRAADAGAAVLQNNPTFRTVYPNKVFDYMACERPVVLAIDGVARELVCEDARAGVYVEPENGAALAEAIAQLADHPERCAAMARQGRTWVEAHASRERLADRYLDVLEELVAKAHKRQSISDKGDAASRAAA